MVPWYAIPRYTCTMVHVRYSYHGTNMVLPYHGTRVPWVFEIMLYCARTTTETVLREAMQALWRVQAHMLARIVVEIRAADIAVESEP
jgi:hypothetical protein